MTAEGCHRGLDCPFRHGEEDVEACREAARERAKERDAKIERGEYDPKQGIQDGPSAGGKPMTLAERALKAKSAENVEENPENNSIEKQTEAEENDEENGHDEERPAKRQRVEDPFGGQEQSPDESPAESEE